MFLNSRSKPDEPYSNIIIIKQHNTPKKGSYIQ